MTESKKSYQYQSYFGEDSGNSQKIIKELIKYDLTGKKYKGLKEISQGGMGIIYQAKDHGLQRNTVLKVIQSDEENSELYNQFIEEARITGLLEHPNIIPVHDIGVLNKNQLFFSMKYIEGLELNDIIDGLYDDDPRFYHYSLYKLLTIFRKVCDAAAFAHSKGIIHRDIKPENIMVGEFGEVLLVDWGLAKREDEPEPERKGLLSLFQSREAMMIFSNKVFAVS